MRHVAFAVAVAAFFFAVAPLRAQAPQPAAENLAAARELVQVMKATDQFKTLLPSIFAALKPAFVQGQPEAERDYDTIMPIVLAGAMKRLNEFADKLAVIYANNFSIGELHDLTAFYQTPTGQKLIAQQPVIARESMAMGQAFGQTLVNDLKEEIGEELRKRGDTK